MFRQACPSTSVWSSTSSDRTEVEGLNTNGIFLKSLDSHFHGNDKTELDSRLRGNDETQWLPQPRPQQEIAEVHIALGDVIDVPVDQT